LDLPTWSSSLVGFLLLTAPDGGGEGAQEVGDGQGRAGRVDVPGRVHGRTKRAAVGGAVIGRRTFDLGVGPWGGTPWPGVPSFVVTHRARQGLLGNNGGTFAFDGLQAAVRRAKQAAGHKDVLVLGADVARQLLRAELLDEIHVHLVPLLLGAGRHCSMGSRPS
jgi:hypothetical protein